jgi:phosphopantothenoylcysteine decarboxylase/phosphopantothenate--cysteine ligase
MMTGSIACYKACHVLSRLVQAGYEVQTAATESALQFIGPATLEGLTGKPLVRGMFAASHRREHIDLARWADLLMVCPATANAINGLAAGIADDIPGAVFLANNFLKPFWIVPAMNAEMYRHPATQTALARLAGWGATILESESGALACGEHGAGRLMEPDDILARITGFFNPDGTA